MHRGNSNASSVSPSESSACFRDDISLADGFGSEPLDQDDAMSIASEATCESLSNTLAHHARGMALSSTRQESPLCLGVFDVETLCAVAAQGCAAHSRDLAAAAAPAHRDASTVTASLGMAKKTQKAKSKQLRKQGSLPRQGSLTRQGSLKREGSLQRKKREAARLAVAAVAATAAAASASAMAATETAGAAAGCSMANLSASRPGRKSRLSRCSPRVEEESSKCDVKAQSSCPSGATPSGKPTASAGSIPRTIQGGRKAASSPRSPRHSAAAMQRAAESHDPTGTPCSTGRACTRRQAGSPCSGVRAATHWQERAASTAPSCQVMGQLPSTGSGIAVAGTHCEMHCDDLIAADVLVGWYTSAPFRTSPQAAKTSGAAVARVAEMNSGRNAPAQQESREHRRRASFTSPVAHPTSHAPSAHCIRTSSWAAATVARPVAMPPAAARQQRPRRVSLDSHLAAIPSSAGTAPLPATTAMQADGLSLPVDASATQQRQRQQQSVYAQSVQAKILPSLQRSRRFREGASGSKHVPAKMKRLIQQWIEGEAAEGEESEIQISCAVEGVIQLSYAGGSLSATGGALSQSGTGTDSAGYREVVTGHCLRVGRPLEKRQVALTPILVGVKPACRATAGSCASPGSAPSRVVRLPRPKNIEW